MDLVNSLLDTSENQLNSLFDNEYLSGLLKILLISYACIISPKLPQSILQLFDNTIIKLLIIFAIVYVAKRDFTIALLISIAFVITLQVINKNKLSDLSDIKNVLSGGSTNNPSQQPIVNNSTDQPIVNDVTSNPLDQNVSQKNLDDISNAGILTKVLLGDDNNQFSTSNPITTGPVQETTGPVQETTGPVQETTGPVQETTGPVQETTGPVQETTGPIQETTGPIQETTGPVQETMGPVQETMGPQTDNIGADLFDLLKTAQPLDGLNNNLDSDSKIFESVQSLETQQPTVGPVVDPVVEPTMEPTLGPVIEPTLGPVVEKISDLKDSDLNIFNKELEKKNKVGCFPNTPNEGLLMSNIAANSAAF